ncbi:tripartite tricarboxylate transporter substrate binding protein [Pigmentiphaga soli]|uniref:Tripartite tricarboxylate transporter substrate binding protein n=1 Tax=Pigmentiphaga soli TaxID=1007095 RepID=A0ABP8GNH0_9BURK
MDTQRRRFNQLGVAAAALAAAPQVRAQRDPAANFPSRPVRLIIPFAPGGGTDIVGRAIGDKLGQEWGQPVVVENKAGANGTIGADMVVKSPPDGYMMCMFTASHSVNVTLQGKQQPYDLFKDFAPLSLLAVQPYILVVRPGLPVKSVADLVALAKAKPGTINFGSSGVGGLIHLCGELFQARAGIKLAHIPYKGGSQAMMDVIAGNIDMMFTSLNQSKTYIDAGQLRLLAVTSAKRSPVAPDIPTMQEAGVPDYEVESWYGLAAPAAVPKPILAKLNTSIDRVLKLPDVRERLAADGSTPVGGSAERFGTFLRNEVEKWRALIDQVGIPVG